MILGWRRVKPKLFINHKYNKCYIIN